MCNQLPSPRCSITNICNFFLLQCYSRLTPHMGPRTKLKNVIVPNRDQIYTCPFPTYRPKQIGLIGTSPRFLVGSAYLSKLPAVSVFVETLLFSEHSTFLNIRFRSYTCTLFHGYESILLYSTYCRYIRCK